jgi:hypothetical protein
MSSKLECFFVNEKFSACLGSLNVDSDLSQNIIDILELFDNNKRP